MATRDDARSSGAEPSPWYCVHESERAAVTTMAAAGLATAAALVATGGLVMVAEWLLAGVAAGIALLAGWNTWASARSLHWFDRRSHATGTTTPAAGPTRPAGGTTRPAAGPTGQAGGRPAPPRPGGTTRPATMPPRAPVRPGVPVPPRGPDRPPAPRPPSAPPAPGAAPPRPAPGPPPPQSHAVPPESHAAPQAPHAVPQASHRAPGRHDDAAPTEAPSTGRVRRRTSAPRPVRRVAGPRSN